MSRKSTSSGLEAGWGYAYVIGQESPDRIVGKIIGVLEVLGLSEKQEESAKNLVREQVWHVFKDAIRITPERHNPIREAYYAKRKEIGTDVPMSAI